MIINILQNELLTCKALATTCEANLTTTYDTDMDKGPDGTEILYFPFFFVDNIGVQQKKNDADMHIGPEGKIILYCPYFL